MTITQIRYFVQVAENMNFTKAARQLYVAQQVVSKQVKRLEEELGFLLFESNSTGDYIVCRWTKNVSVLEKNADRTAGAD